MVDFISMQPIPPRLREPLAAALRGQRTEWPESLTGAELAALGEHGVIPLVYASSDVSQLREEATRAAVVEPLRLAELQRVLVALAGRAIRPLILKGTALAYSLYDAPELRPRGDCDLLIDRADFETLRECLIGRGYEQAIDSGDELALRQASFSRVDDFGVEHLFDVHWAIANTPVFASVLRYEELSARAVPLPRISEQARGLCDVDALLLACIHRVAHHHDSERLIWLVDIHFLREALSDDGRRVFWRRAVEGEVVAICRRAFALTAQWFGDSSDDGAARWLTDNELTADEPTERFLDRGQSRAALLATNLAPLPWSARLRRLRQLAFPPAAFMRSQFRVQGRAALPFLYAYRGLRGIARLFRRVA